MSQIVRNSEALESSQMIDSKWWACGDSNARPLPCQGSVGPETAQLASARVDSKGANVRHLQANFARSEPQQASLAAVRVGPTHVAIIDAADYPKIAAFKWRLKKSRGGVLYARGWLRVGNRQYREIGYMHKLLCPAGPTENVDHVDGNGLNNTRANLRACSIAENVRNQRRHCDNSSGFKGVSKNGAVFRARITVNRRSLSLGTHPTLKAAAAAYDEAAKRYFGEFARLNFPKGDQL